MRERRPRLPSGGAARAAPPPWLGATLSFLLVAACFRPAVEPRSVPVPGEARTFEGTWSAFGVGGRLSAALAGVSWPAAYVALVVLYVLMHYLFVSQSSQVLALFGVFVDVGMRAGVPTPLPLALLFASSYFSTITPQGGSQNVIFVGSGYLTQGELYKLGALTTIFCLLVFLLLGTPWLFLVVR
jgi:di/tricarboxylate transporter